MHGGEVDLVARRGRTVAFVEVKQRRSDEASAMALDERRLEGLRNRSRTDRGYADLAARYKAAGL